MRICFDVLLDVLHFGDRRRLIKLERVGRRFHWIIEKWFLDVPFLRLDLELNPLNLTPAEPRYLCLLHNYHFIKQTELFVHNFLSPSTCPYPEL